MKSAVMRIFGAAIFLVGVVLIFVLAFRDTSLASINIASSFGDAGITTDIVNAGVYVFGWIPTLFLFLYVARIGVSVLFGWKPESAPEYDVLRTFLALCFGAAGFGAIWHGAAWGGMLGAIVAHDLSLVTAGAGWIFGILFIMAFAWFAGGLLHIRLRDARAAVRIAYRTIRWLLSAFHIIRPAAVDENSEELEEDEASEDEDNEDKKIKRKKSEIRNQKSEIKSSKAAKTATDRNYELPPPSYLEKSTFTKNSVTPEMKRNAAALETHFEEFGVYGKVAGIKPGPIVTLYEFEPDSGMRIAKIADTVKDMTRAMAAENIRIAHIPRSNFIGVEMVNLDRQTLRMRSLITNDDFMESRYHIPLALGVDIGGNPIYFDLAKMPHVLIAGRTGSGKSVFVQSIIMSIVYHFTPDECKLVVIDPKGVDFTLWHDIPHLVTPIVTDATQAVNALKWAVREMEERYKKLKDVGVQNLEGYNEAVARMRANGETPMRSVPVGTDPETGGLEFEERPLDLSDMPYMVVIIDEVADLMSVARKEVEACVQRLAQKARAAGIHVVAATQRPDTTVITGVIKANFPTRISFQARSSIDSGTTLGEKGAEQLLAFGDMLFSEAGRVPVRIHGSWIENKEINRVADFLRAEGEPEYADNMDLDAAQDGGEDGFGGGLPDAIPGLPVSKDAKDADLYRQAKDYVLRDKKPTISYVQRRLGVGYNKAAGFIERMEQEGIVSSPDANNKRHIL